VRARDSRLVWLEAAPRRPPALTDTKLALFSKSRASPTPIHDGRLPGLRQAHSPPTPSPPATTGGPSCGPTRGQFERGASDLGTCRVFDHLRANTVW
jgi:hypothetical protein